jgi:large subunit ribosomal protein L18
MKESMCVKKLESQRRLSNMDKMLVKRNARRKKRMLRVRKHLRGCSGKPRLSVNKTNKHLSAQLIDDEKKVTLLGMSTASRSLKEKWGKKSKEAAEYLGQALADRAKKEQINRVVFDRGRYKYHGMIAVFADSVRKAGLKF